MTQEEFVKRWRYHVAGLALFGTLDTEGPLGRAIRAYDIPATVEQMLTRMWADAQPAMPTPLPEPTKAAAMPNNKQPNQPAPTPAQPVRNSR